MPQFKLLRVFFHPYYKMNEADVQHWDGCESYWLIQSSDNQKQIIKK